MTPSLVRRTLSALATKLVLPPAPALIDVSPPDTKASSFALLPSGAYGPAYSFFSPDGGRTMIDIADLGSTALAFVAYWYVAVRWRAQKIAEAPLMVIAESQDDGSEEWLPDHELVSILDEPSPDYDMGELLERTSQYLDNTGAVLWVMDRDRGQRIARITPFSRSEFESHKDATRLFATFTVQTADGPRDFAAETCCLFRESQGSWSSEKSRLDVALQWLRLGAKATKTIYDLLNNSVWPSGVLLPDKDWNPDPETFDAYKADLQNYAKSGNKGKPFVALGGGSFTALQSAIKDLVPEDILNRVESVISAVSGVPAVVLQLQVGMENSPWSQMGEARRMAYADCIVPAWRKMERVLTRQMLRGVDDDPTHFIRFDRSQIDSLQEDEQAAVSIAVMMGRAASLNERRAKMGLEPVTDNPKADEIPELTQPSMAEILAGTSQTGQDKPAADNTPPPPPPPADTAKKSWLERKFKTAVLQDAFRDEARTVWQVHVGALLKHDADQIAGIVESFLTDAVHKSVESKARGKGRAMAAVTDYLNTEAKSRWSKTAGPLMVRGAERSTAVISADLGVSYNLLHANVLKFAHRETGRLITNVSDTTKSMVADVIQGGLDAGESTTAIARLIRDATGFSTERAKLIARTETTKVFAGAPTESLSELGASTGRTFTKTWSGVLDDRERDEHVAMEGETVPIDQAFSNGEQYPGEPNCRCTLLYGEEDL